MGIRDVPRVLIVHMRYFVYVLCECFPLGREWSPLQLMAHRPDQTDRESLERKTGDWGGKTDGMGWNRMGRYVLNTAASHFITQP